MDQMATRREVALGCRVRAVKVGKAPFTVAPGTRGTVDYISRVSVEGSKFMQVGVVWDNEQYFMCCLPPDVLDVLG